ncbi:MAG: hypothetical protein QXO20_02000 [Candidatus Bathyarchaeia archaeon]
MPTIAIDTFFACSLMVILILSAMVITSKITYSWIYATEESETIRRYRAVAEHIILATGNPIDWGGGREQPTAFGLAKHGQEGTYNLDMDKVSRLNNENLYALTYGQVFESLNMPGVSLRIEISPIFETKVDLARTVASTNEATYEFKVKTVKDECHYVPAWLQYYIVADGSIINSGVKCSDGVISFNVTIPYNVSGPALLVVLSKSVYDARIVSFNVYSFQHADSEPKPKGSFMRLSPLNFTLYACTTNLELSNLQAYALTFNHAIKLEQRASSALNTSYTIPRLYESSPIVLVVTGRTSTGPFIEWTVYPQIPVCIGVDYTSYTCLTNFYVYSYPVIIGSCVYQCKIWLGETAK